MPFSGSTYFRFLTSIFALSLASFAGEPSDRHYTEDPATAIYAQCGFAHGYMHGYEDGFHIGNQDYQLGRSEREVQKSAEFRDGTGGYRGGFGNKKIFRQGYREGFALGYSDSFHDRSFRAAGAMRRVAEGVPLQASTRPGSAFDSGFQAGYQAAQAGGPAQRGDNCSSTEGFCEGYNRGYDFLQLLSGNEARRDTLAQNRQGDSRK